MTFKNRTQLSDSERDRAVELRRQHLPLAEIGEILNRDITTIARCLKLALSTEERIALSYAIGQGPRVQEREFGPPPEILAERERRSHLKPRDLTAHLCGDPLPGFSAWDRRV